MCENDDIEALRYDVAHYKHKLDIAESLIWMIERELSEIQQNGSFLVDNLLHDVRKFTETLSSND